MAWGEPTLRVRDKICHVRQAPSRRRVDRRGLHGPAGHAGDPDRRRSGAVLVPPTVLPSRAPMSFTPRLFAVERELRWKGPLVIPGPVASPASLRITPCNPPSSPRTPSASLLLAARRRPWPAPRPPPLRRHGRQLLPQPAMARVVAVDLVPRLAHREPRDGKRQPEPAQRTASHQLGSHACKHAAWFRRLDRLSCRRPERVIVADTCLKGVCL